MTRASGFLALPVALSVVALHANAPIAGQSSSTLSGVTLTVHIAEDRRQFRPGQAIPIELVFMSAVPRRFVVGGAQYDRSGRVTLDEWHIEPMDRITDPMLDYFASAGGYIGGGLRGMSVQRVLDVVLEGARVRATSSLSSSFVKCRHDDHEAGEVHEVGHEDGKYVGFLRGLLRVRRRAAA